MATAPKSVQKPALKEASAPSPAPRKSRSKAIWLVLVVLLAVAGTGAWFWYSAIPRGDATAAAKPEPPKVPVFFVLDPFTVNLQPDGQGDQYLQVAFSVQVDSSKSVEHLKLYLPQVRSRMVLLLSSKKASEISTAEGKQRLVDEIITQLKLPFSPGAEQQNIHNVFFTSFVIQ